MNVPFISFNDESMFVNDMQNERTRQLADFTLQMSDALALQEAIVPNQWFGCLVIVVQKELEEEQQDNFHKVEMIDVLRRRVMRQKKRFVIEKESTLGLSFTA